MAASTSRIGRPGSRAQYPAELLTIDRKVHADGGKLSPRANKTTPKYGRLRVPHSPETADRRPVPFASAISPLTPADTRSEARDLG